jgi:hypothetical protein
MPSNSGERPACETVDIKFRNGTIARRVDPKKYRWEADSRFPPQSAGDIVSWQPIK